MNTCESSDVPEVVSEIELLRERISVLEKKQTELLSVLIKLFRHNCRVGKQKDFGVENMIELFAMSEDS